MTKRNISILIFEILLNRTFITFKYKDIFKMKKKNLFTCILYFISLKLLY